jgi:ribonuclease VapC
MIIETSALVAVLDQEPEAERIARTLASTSERMLSAANLVEVGIVMQARRGDDGARDLDLLLAKLRVDIVAVTATQADIARKAFRHYGRGRHAANLNFGDCFAYALAKDKSASLLFKGDDFGRTDVIVAPY